MGVFGSWCDKVWKSLIVLIQTGERLEKIVNLSLTRGPFGEVRCIQISTAKGLETRGISRVIIINGEKKDATYGAS